MVALIERPQIALKGPQADFYWDDREFIVYRGGRGTGKSTSACARIQGMIQRREIKPGARILVGGPTYPQLKMGTLKTFDEHFDGTGLVVDKVNGNEPERRLVNDITVYFRNMSNPDQTRGHSVQVAWLDEFGQMTGDVIRLTSALLRQFGNDAKYQTILTSTPRAKDWSWRMFYSPERKLKDDQVGAYHLTTVEAEKLGIARKGYVAAMGYEPGTPDYEREVLGNYAAWTGLVFSKFNAERHCQSPYAAKNDDTFILPKFQTVYGGIDVGYGAYTAITLTGLSQAGAMFTFKEFHKRGVALHEWMKVCAEWEKKYDVRAWYIDSAAKQEYNAIRGQLRSVRQSMKVKDAAGSAVGYINSKFLRDELFIDAQECPFLVSEIENYQYKEHQSGDEVTFLDTVKPKQADDSIDSWRYHVLPLSAHSARLSYGQVITPVYGATRYDKSGTSPATGYGNRFR